MIVFKILISILPWWAILIWLFGTGLCLFVVSVPVAVFVLWRQFKQLSQDVQVMKVCIAVKPPARPN